MQIFVIMGAVLGDKRAQCSAAKEPSNQ